MNWATQDFVADVQGSYERKFGRRRTHVPGSGTRGTQESLRFADLGCGYRVQFVLADAYFLSDEDVEVAEGAAAGALAAGVEAAGLSLLDLDSPPGLALLSDFESPDDESPPDLESPLELAPSPEALGLALP